MPNEDGTGQFLPQFRDDIFAGYLLFAGKMLSGHFRIPPKRWSTTRQSTPRDTGVAIGQSAQLK